LHFLTFAEMIVTDSDLMRATLGIGRILGWEPSHEMHARTPAIATTPPISCSTPPAIADDPNRETTAVPTLERARPSKEASK